MRSRAALEGRRMAIEAIVTGVAVARADPMEDRCSGGVDKSAFGKTTSSQDPRLSEAEGENRRGKEGIQWENVGMQDVVMVTVLYWRFVGLVVVGVASDKKKKRHQVLSPPWPGSSDWPRSKKITQ